MDFVADEIQRVWINTETSSERGEGVNQESAQVISYDPAGDMNTVTFKYGILKVQDGFSLMAPF